MIDLQQENRILREQLSEYKKSFDHLASVLARTREARDYMEEVVESFSEKYLSRYSVYGKAIELFAKDHLLSEDQAMRLIQLAQEVLMNS